MKEVNEPNEFELFPHDLNHPYYWIYKVENVRIKTFFLFLTVVRIKFRDTGDKSWVSSTTKASYFRCTISLRMNG